MKSLWLGLAVALAAVGVARLAWMAHGQAAPASAPEAPAAFPWHRAGAGDLAPWPVPTAVEPVGAATRPQLGAHVDSPADGRSTLDLCGHGTVSLRDRPGPWAPGSPDGPAPRPLAELPGPIGHQALDAVRARLILALHQQGTGQGTVAALLMQRPADEDPQGRAQWAAAVRDAALASGDALALAWAQDACMALPDDAACRLQLVRARTAVEPQSAQHWAALADLDPSSSDQAWAGIVAARHWREAPSSRAALAFAAVPPDVPGYLRLAIGRELMEADVPTPTPGEGLMQERCSQAEGTRLQQCQAVAELLSTQGDGGHSLAQAERLGRLLQWPQARLADLRQGADRDAQARTRWHEHPGDLSCGGVDDWVAQFERFASMPRALAGVTAAGR